MGNYKQLGETRQDELWAVIVQTQVSKCSDAVIASSLRTFIFLWARRIQSSRKRMIRIQFFVLQSRSLEPGGLGLFLLLAIRVV